MHQLTQWQQAGAYDAYNPNQIIREPDNTYGPSMTGGVSSFYFNKQPTTVKSLNLEGLRGRGLGGTFSFTSLDPGVQMLLVFLLAGAAGYFGVKYGGPALGLGK